MEQLPPYVDMELVALQLSLRGDTPKPAPFKKVWAKVTACSPSDPADTTYYRKFGYEGAAHNVAACYSQFPKGTLLRVPGYLDTSYPNKFWEVDSRGGSVIRRSARKGVYHIDVKFTSYASAKAWGTRWMYIDVIYP